VTPSVEPLRHAAAPLSLARGRRAAVPLTLARGSRAAVPLTLAHGRRAAASLTLALILCAAGCGGAHAPRSAPTPTGTPSERSAGARPPSDADQVRELLDRRAAALELGDAAAYAATAIGAQRRRDRQAARRARPLGLHAVTLSAERFAIAGDNARVRMRVRYGLRGIAGRFEAIRDVTARRTAGGWRVVRDTSVRERHPWEVAAFRAGRSRHFVLLTPRPVPGLAEAFETGYGRIRRALPSAALRRRYLVVVASDRPMARALTREIGGVESLAAIADAEVRETGPARRVTEVLSQRVVVIWPSFAPLGSADRARLATHELTHVALAPTTSGRTPAWLLEGVALWTSGDRRSADAAQVLTGRQIAGAGPAEMAAARRVLSLSSLARPDAIGRLAGLRQAAAYAYASAAAFLVAERYGRRRLLALYDAFNDERLSGRPGAALDDRAVRRVLGVSLARLDRDLHDALTRR
jgi:hypothetical protein